jgi:hypothetical protein
MHNNFIKSGFNYNVHRVFADFNFRIGQLFGKKHCKSLGFGGVKLLVFRIAPLNAVAL